MSYFDATVCKIDSCDSLHVVEFKFHKQTLKMMSLDLSENIVIGSRVKLVVKPSHVSIAKNFSGEISCSNKLSATITSCENGELLTALTLDVFGSTLESIITKSSSLKMALHVDDCVTALIKSSELSITEVYVD
ncbi:MAG: TOBE domain-containing protein [Campylobacterota bacterium]|nr:TOBE domain-containing protein [Campylobacterota bacterium]